MRPSLTTPRVLGAGPRYARNLGLSLFGAIALVACATANNFGSSDDPTAGPPHALGTVLLGEAHSTSTTGTVAPVVSVGFIPDSTAAKKCSTAMDGCEIVTAPKCATACGVGEVCSYNDSCQPTCTKTCSKSCGDGEECYFPSPGADPECRAVETFDSGPVAFAGTSVPITLYPPYKYSGPTTGAPFVPGASITVQASGAAATGFSAWSQSVTATTLLQTQLGQLTKAKVFGSDALPVQWTAGDDSIVITLSGAGGTATCKAKDSAGEYDVARDLVNEVLGPSSTLGVSVSRQRVDTKKGIATKGSMSTAHEQKEGWVQVTTFSTESTSFQGCTTGGAMCGGACVDTSSDQNNCGKCGNACGGGESCVAGSCQSGTTQTCDQCITDAVSGACASEAQTCDNNPDCADLTSCLGGCNGDSTCSQNCANSYANGISDYNARASCFCQVACTSECASTCGG